MSLWPSFDPARILLDDGWLLAIDKPVGVPSQASAEGRTDDVLTRLRQHLGGAYLGMHQRLDKETSGAMVFARRKEANASLARQFEGRLVTKSYLVGVTGFKGDRRTLKNWIRPRRGGGSEVLDRRAKGAKEAVSHVELIERVEGRALLRVRIETGRTHQIRAQLAHIGAPVAGDSLYGGVAAARLMLHAESLKLEHPSASREVVIEASAPEALSHWLHADKEPFAEILGRAIERRYHLGVDERTTVFRLLQGDAEGEPGVAIDHYGHDEGSHLVVHFYDHPQESRVLDALETLGLDGVYLKRHPRQANELVKASDELAPVEPVRGSAAPVRFTVREAGLCYEVSLAEGLPTGLYLDQRDARERVREHAKDRRVLNLFAYTGGFSVAAAAGDARSTLTIDASGAALERFARNLQLNGIEGEHEHAVRDCFEVLESLKRQNERFDLIVCDPPTYARTKKTRWRSGRGWVDLSAACLELAAPRAILLLCSNDSRMPMQRFRRYVHEGSRLCGRPVQQMKDLSPPIDFPALGGSHPLKRLWIGV